MFFQPMTVFVPFGSHQTWLQMLVPGGKYFVPRRARSLITAPELVGMVVIVAGVAITTAAPTLPPRVSARETQAQPTLEAEPSEV